VISFHKRPLLSSASEKDPSNQRSLPTKDRNDYTTRSINVLPMVSSFLPVSPRTPVHPTIVDCLGIERFLLLPLEVEDGALPLGLMCGSLRFGPYPMVGSIRQCALPSQSTVLGCFPWSSNLRRIGSPCLRHAETSFTPSCHSFAPFLGKCSLQLGQSGSLA
jgi:hypothetical protein